METAELSEVCEIVMGQSPPSSSYNVTGDGLPFFQGKIDFSDTYPRVRVYCSQPSRVALPGDVLICVRAPVGPTNLVDRKCCIGRGLAALRPKDRLNTVFLSYFLRYFEPRLASQGVGSTFDAINRDDLEELRIPFPDLAEQKRIAAILERADRLRRLRRNVLDTAEQFLPAAFLRLFGDPRQFNARWEMAGLGDLGTLDRGRSRYRPRNAAHLYGGKYPFVQTGDVANSGGYIRSHTQTYSEEGLKQSKLWPARTLCITIAANIAKTGILTYESCFPDSVVGFIPGKRVRLEYVQFWLGFLQELLERTAPEVAQKNINLEILEGLQCPVPPMSLQSEFANLVDSYERLRRVHGESLRQAEHLFQALLQRAFTMGI